VLRFEWDATKNTESKRKHRVSFEEAQTVFYDDRAILIEDEDENEDNEERFLLLGLSATLRVFGRLPLLSREGPGDPADLRTQGHTLRAPGLRDEVEAMRKSYDFSKGRKNPYARRLKKQITIRLDEETLEYFKRLAEEAEVPYQTLINLFLRDCARGKKRLSMKWEAA